MSACDQDPGSRDVGCRGWWHSGVGGTPEGLDRVVWESNDPRNGDRVAHWGWCGYVYVALVMACGVWEGVSVAAASSSSAAEQPRRSCNSSCTC